ncbi:hypothetical protein SCOCK_260047 [Actinacidiphila cocklensis]|uniref:Uncharacterized protein n=1 Tax=Actinacidiphila cocklensis TaxID=887465 RepID=A0A9W4GRF6_9ACTN|nr:hypothetical protein SCOCK_260047 [Actinacidiphila cocklensis]
MRCHGHAPRVSPRPERVLDAAACAIADSVASSDPYEEWHRHASDIPSRRRRHGRHPGGRLGRTDGRVRQPAGGRRAVAVGDRGLRDVRPDAVHPQDRGPAGRARPARGRTGLLPPDRAGLLRHR